MSPQTTDLYTALQWHLPWHKARVKFIAAFVLALIQVTTVNLVRIANGLNGNADRKSNYRRIQRFFALFDLDYDLLAGLVVTLLPPRKDWLITLDRTPWQFGQLQINILDSTGFCGAYVVLSARRQSSYFRANCHGIGTG